MDPTSIPVPASSPYYLLAAGVALFGSVVTLLIWQVKRSEARQDAMRSGHEKAQKEDRVVYDCRLKEVSEAADKRCAETTDRFIEHLESSEAKNVERLRQERELHEGYMKRLDENTAVLKTVSEGQQELLNRLPKPRARKTDLKADSKTPTRRSK